MVRQVIPSLRAFLEKKEYKTVMEEFKAENGLSDDFEFNDELREKLARKMTDRIMGKRDKFGI